MEFNRFLFCLEKELMRKTVLIKRIFLPVGQGAFYCECFEDSVSGRRFNFVYDCGARPSVRNIKRVFEDFLYDVSTIDAVFISHFHEDHINGLQFLAKKCKIKRIFFPHMEDEDLLLMKLDYITRRFESKEIHRNDGYRFVMKVLSNPQQALARLVSDNDYDSEDTHNDIIAHDDIVEDIFIRESFMIHIKTNGVGIDSVGRRNNSARVRNNTRVFSAVPNWIYKVCCIRNDVAVIVIRNKLAQLVKKEFGKPDATITAEILAELIMKSKADGKFRTKLRETYKDIGDFNVNSLVLYSGCRCLNELIKVRVCCSRFFTWRHCGCFGLDRRRLSYCYLRKRNAVGCLYTGDFNAKDHWKELYSMFKKEWDSIGCVQIPHHGSEKSYNDEFLSMGACHVISAGIGNQYSHPSQSVLDRYDGEKICPPIAVTQYSKSCACWDIELNLL